MIASGDGVPAVLTPLLLSAPARFDPIFQIRDQNLPKMATSATERMRPVLPGPSGAVAGGRRAVPSYPPLLRKEPDYDSVEESVDRSGGVAVARPGRGRHPRLDT